MKKLLFLSMCFLSICPVHAQQTGVLRPHRPGEYFFDISLLNNAKAGAAHKTTQLKERVIAQCTYYGYGAEVMDSTVFIYNNTNGNGSQFDHYTSQYPTLLTEEGAVYQGSYTPLYYQPCVLADTTRLYRQNYTDHSVFDMIETICMQFDNNYNVIGVTDLFLNPYSNTKSVTNFNLQNKAVDQTMMDHLGDTSYLDRYTYVNGTLIADTTYHFSSSAPTTMGYSVYTYDSFGDVVSAGGKIYTYTPAHQLMTAKYYSGSILYENDTFGYTGSWPYATYERMYFRSTPPDEFTTYISPTTGLVDSVVGVLSNFSLIFKGVFHYDSLDNPIDYPIYFANGQNDYTNYDAHTYSFPDTPAQVYRFYYETYDATSVRNASAPLDNIVVYPNPANNALYISNLRTNKKVVISFTNELGQLVMTQTGSGNSLQQVNIVGLLPAVYLVTITDAFGNKLHTQRFIKQ